MIEDYVQKKIQHAKESKSISLDLKGLEIEVLPDEIGELTELKFLTLSENKIKFLPSSFSKLKKLERLHLKGNLFDKFPEEVLELENLDHLCLSGNEIEEIPKNINRLVNLQELFISDNKIKAFEYGLLDLLNMKHLCLHDNDIVSIPEDFGRLAKITELHLHNNKLEKLPLTLENAFYINYISFFGNPIIDPPMDILENGYNAIVKYLLEKEQGVNFKIPIDVHFKTALKQYLVFFSDFVLASKGVEIDFEVASYTEGLELKIKPESDQELSDIQSYLEEYISFTKNSIENINPHFTNKIDDDQKDLLIVDLKNQLRNMQSTIDIRSLENKMLVRESEKLYNLLVLEKQFPQPLLIQSQSSSIAHSNNHNEIMIEIKNELPDLQKDIYEFKNLVQEIKEPGILNELELIDSQILEIECLESSPEKMNKVPFKKLKRILDEINNDDSTFGKFVKASGKTIDAAKKLGKTYNKFAQWLALPQVPEIFVS